MINEPKPSEQEMMAVKALHAASDGESLLGETHAATIIATHTRHEGKTAFDLACERDLEKCNTMKAEARVNELEGALREWMTKTVPYGAGEYRRAWCAEKQRAEELQNRVKELETERSAMANHVLVEDERHDRLLQAEAENIMLRRELSLISHLHPGPGEPGSIARRAIAANKPDDEVARLRQRVKELERANQQLHDDYVGAVDDRRKIQAEAVEYAAGRKQVQASPGAQAELFWLAAAIRRGEVEI